MMSDPCSQLPAVFEAFPLGITLADPTGRIIATNAESERLLGLPSREHAQRTLESEAWIILRVDGTPMPPEEYASVRALKEGRKITDVWMGVLRPDHEVVWLDVSACPLPDGSILVTYADISERRRGEAILEARARLVERAPSLDLEGLLRATLDEAERLTRSCIGFYHFVSPDQENLQLQAWSTQTKRDFCRAEGEGLHYPVTQAGIWADCLRQKQPLVHNDYESEPHKKGLPPGHADVKRELTVPVLRNGKVVAILGVGNKLAPYHERDVDSIQRLADFAWDLAERKAAEAALRESLQTSDDIVQAIPSGLFIYQFEAPDRLVLSSGNPESERLTGLKLQHLLGKEFNEIYPRAKAIGLTDRFLDVIRKGKTFETEDVVYSDHRITGAFRVRAFPLPHQRLAVAFENITELKRSLQELAETKAIMEAAFEATDIPIALLSAPDAVIQLANRACLEFLGIQDEPSWIGKSIQNYVPSWRDFDAEGRPLSLQELPVARALRGESVHAQEIRTQRKDGTSRWNFTSACPIYNEKGSLIAAVLLFPDITERKQAEAEHRQMQEQLQHAQKMESLGNLASGVAHDMNNVLGAILGLATLCRENQTEGTPLARAMDTITTACERGRTMVQSLLGFARKSLAEKRVVNLNALVQEEVSLLERTTLAKYRIRMELAPNLRPIEGDPTPLSQAIMNLCVNAMDAMPEGGTLTLRTCNGEGDQVHLVVEDTGCGMSPEVMTRAMDPFFTTKPHGKGTGLGLAMTYGCLKAHGGNVQLKSEPGQGTQVLLCFPACAQPVSETESLAGHPHQESAPQDHTILLVDDDELIRLSMGMALESMGCQAIIVESGEEALEKLEQGLRPNLVILDLNMPGLGGEGTLPRLRELNADVPILLATGRADQHAQDLVQAHPGVHLLPKPFSVSKLREFIEHLT